MRRSNSTQDEFECSFCGTTISKDESKGRIVAGPTAFICRDCVELCIEVFAKLVPGWSSNVIDKLQAIAQRSNQDE